MKYVEKFDSLEYYTQNSGQNITYQFIVKPGTMGLLSAGRVRLKGPTQKSIDSHKHWDQVYIILKGSGTVIVNDKKYRVEPESIVRIPKGTVHGVILDEQEELEYCYFNAFESKSAIEEFVKNMGLVKK